MNSVKCEPWYFMTLPTSPSPLPLTGIKVADFSQGVAGPHASFLLANQGAEVTKIEPPEGDWGRNLGKRFGSFSAFSVCYNRGKRSLALDLKQARARRSPSRWRPGRMWWSNRFAPA